ncbi:MAG: hypothetical protein JRH20_29055, partial [Deltaproteobacteria bacterium]|nr:hypothetical protein [Deltaproteobacteria bacterium]
MGIFFGAILLVVACGGCPASLPLSQSPGAASRGLRIANNAQLTPAADLADLAPEPMAKTRRRAREVVTGHPRIWLTAADLPRLRSWARADNPLWSQGLAPLAQRAKALMDKGTVPRADKGSVSWEEYPTEMYAAFFAFMSLVHPESAARADFSRRARTLLLHVMNTVLKAGQGAFRAPNFSTYDRSRYWGECFGLTVDWIYSSLSDSDKKTIHRVFSRWVQQNARARTTTKNHPRPRGLKRDKRLLADESAVRWSANNYYLAHLRNLTLMGLALDPADDPGGTLKGAFEDAVGAWLYVNDHFRRHDGRGGLSPEGPYYSPESVSYVMQALFALYTSGRDDPARYGRQVALAGQPYWRDILPAWSHLYPPASRVRERWRGPVWEAAWSADGSREFIIDPIAIFGPLGVYHAHEGNARALAAVRWMQLHFPAGGREKLTARRDPRASFGKTYLAAGTGQLFARTGWDANARAVRFFCGWLTVDHQHG